MKNPLMEALSAFEAAEANLVKLERLVNEAASLADTFGPNPEYEDRVRAIDLIVAALPAIDGWKPEISMPDSGAVAQNRFDAQDVGELEAIVAAENWADEPGRQVREYRFRFDQKRRELVRDSLIESIDGIDAKIRELRQLVDDAPPNGKMDVDHWSDLRSRFDQITVLLGSSVAQPAHWNYLARHLHFGMVCDFDDIEKTDWPGVKSELRQGLYGINEPLPVAVADLTDLVRSKPKGSIITKLNWENLTPETFERLIYTLVSGEAGYENPAWLMHTNAPDKGRDLSADRVVIDRLAGTLRLRVVFQCKHWLGRGIPLGDVAEAKEQMSLWNKPRVDVLVIATSGRFTADAVQWIENHNESGNAPRIEMWAESHLEKLLAARPGLIAEFGLR